MALSTAWPVKYTGEQEAQVKKLVRETGLDRSKILRTAIGYFLMTAGDKMDVLKKFSEVNERYPIRDGRTRDGLPLTPPAEVVPGEVVKKLTPKEMRKFKAETNGMEQTLKARRRELEAHERAEPKSEQGDTPSPEKPRTRGKRSHE